MAKTIVFLMYWCHVHFFPNISRPSEKVVCITFPSMALQQVNHKNWLFNYTFCDSKFSKVKILHNLLLKILVKKHYAIFFGALKKWIN